MVLIFQSFNFYTTGGGDSGLWTTQANAVLNETRASALLSEGSQASEIPVARAVASPGTSQAEDATSRLQNRKMQQDRQLH